MSKPTGKEQTPPDEPDDDDIARMLEEMSQASDMGATVPEGICFTPG